MRQILTLAQETFQSFQDDNCMDMAAGIAYYALFSLFPLLLGLIALLGFFLEPASVQKNLLQAASQMFPGSAELVARNIEEVWAARGTIGLVSIAGLFWSATAIFGAVRKSLNRAWKTERQRPFIKQKLVELSMVGSVGLLFLASVTATALFRAAWQLMPPLVRGLEEGFFWNLLTSLVPAVFSFGFLALIYRFLPNTHITWGDVLAGALLAAGLFEIAKVLFAWYLANLANYSLVYGSLTAVIAFLLWAYLSAVILLLGAELAAAYARLLGSQKPR